MPTSYAGVAKKSARPILLRGRNRDREEVSEWHRQLPGPLVFLIGLVYACGPSDTDAVDSSTDTVAVSAQLDSVYAVFTRAYARADADLLMDSALEAGCVGRVTHSRRRIQCPG